jgi:hypothetical protein
MPAIKEEVTPHVRSIEMLGSEECPMSPVIITRQQEKYRYLKKVTRHSKQF